MDSALPHQAENNDPAATSQTKGNESLFVGQDHAALQQRVLQLEAELQLKEASLQTQAKRARVSADLVTCLRQELQKQSMLSKRKAHDVSPFQATGSSTDPTCTRDAAVQALGQLQAVPDLSCKTASASFAALKRKPQKPTAGTSQVTIASLISVIQAPPESCAALRASSKHGFAISATLSTHSSVNEAAIVCSIEPERLRVYTIATACVYQAYDKCFKCN
ncbi:hypothetical protein AAVH_11214 [Aphelenchoides avenae]|nr:hypothetical protein AAVH_11214 [Aphelenchus avenae]